MVGGGGAGSLRAMPFSDVRREAFRGIPVIGARFPRPWRRHIRLGTDHKYYTNGYDVVVLFDAYVLLGGPFRALSSKPFSIRNSTMYTRIFPVIFSAVPRFFLPSRQSKSPGPSWYDLHISYHNLMVTRDNVTVHTRPAAIIINIVGYLSWVDYLRRFFFFLTKTYSL